MFSVVAGPVQASDRRSPVSSVVCHGTFVIEKGPTSSVILSGARRISCFVIACPTVSNGGHGAAALPCHHSGLEPSTPRRDSSTPLRCAQNDSSTVTDYSECHCSLKHHRA